MGGVTDDTCTCTGSSWRERASIRAVSHTATEIFCFGYISILFKMNNPILAHKGGRQ
jgi:hypothetical protein